MTEQLKPCPFCGSADLEVYGKPGILNAHDDVGCNSCNAFTPLPTWNTRTWPGTVVKTAEGWPVTVWTSSRNTGVTVPRELLDGCQYELASWMRDHGDDIKSRKIVEELRALLAQSQEVKP